MCKDLILIHRDQRKCQIPFFSKAIYDLCLRSIAIGIGAKAASVSLRIAKMSCGVSGLISMANA